MFKEILNEIFGKIHELGHAGNAVDRMMDAVDGMGHRIKWGHDLEGMLNALHLEGIAGIGDWFKHMALDFTSPAGIPLPFADTVRIMTGMEMDEAVDWLCFNLADVVEVGAEAFILRAFRDHPLKFKTALAVGTAIGIVDDNPILLAVNTVIFLRMFGRFRGTLFAGQNAGFFSRATNFLSRLAMGTAAVDVGLGLAGVDLAGLVSGLSSTADYADAADLGVALGDIVDGLAMVGIFVWVNMGIRKAFDFLTFEKRARIWEKRAVLTGLEAIKKGISGNMPLPRMAGIIRAIKNSPYYAPRVLDLD